MEIRYRPLYLEVKDEVEKRMADGLYRPGDMIPSESALAAEFGLSISTIRQALSVLVSEGRLLKQQGRGTFVSEQRISLRFLTWLPETPRGETVIQETIEAVEQRFPELSIEIIPTTYPAAKQDLERLIGKGEAPDIAQIVSHWTSHFASIGTLHPLDDLLDRDALSRRSKSKDLVGGQWQDRQYSLSWGLCPLSLIVNRNVTGCADIDLQSCNTPTEFLRICKQIEAGCLGENQYSFGFCLSDEESDFLRLLPFLRAFGGGFADQTGAIRFDTSENVAAFEWLRSFFRSRRVVHSHIFDLRRRFSRGEIAIISDGPWIKLHLEELTGEDFDQNFSVLLNPVDAHGCSRSWNYNHALCVTSQSSYKRYAAKVVQALTSDHSISGDFYRKVGHLPVDSELDQRVFGDEPFYRMYRRQLSHSTCVNSQNAMFEKAMSFCIDAVRRILFTDVNIREELEEKERYLLMLYKE